MNNNDYTSYELSKKQVGINNNRSSSSKYLPNDAKLFSLDDECFCYEKDSIESFENHTTKDLLKDTITVIPCLSDDKFLPNILSYLKQFPNMTTIIVEGGNTFNSKNIAKDFNCLWIHEKNFLNSFISVKEICRFYEIPSYNFCGKGIAQMIGRIIQNSLGMNHMLMLDADINNIDNLRPVEKILGTHLYFRKKGRIAKHVLLATPNRKNDGLHSFLEGIISNITSNSNKNQIAKLILEVSCRRELIINDIVSQLDSNLQRLALMHVHLSPLIHLLTGERFLNRDFMTSMPCITNSLETMINIHAAESNVVSYQAGNQEVLNDAKNSYEKNETMLISCQKLLQSKFTYKSFSLWDTEDYRLFNRSSTLTQKVGLLPLNSNSPLLQIKCTPDYIFPSIGKLVDLGFISKNVTIN